LEFAFLRYLKSLWIIGSDCWKWNELRHGETGYWLTVKFKLPAKNQISSPIVTFPHKAPSNPSRKKAPNKLLATRIYIHYKLIFITFSFSTNFLFAKKSLNARKLQLKCTIINILLISQINDIFKRFFSVVSLMYQFGGVFVEDGMQF
jgi:hypothetical protein